MSHLQVSSLSSLKIYKACSCILCIIYVHLSLFLSLLPYVLDYIYTFSYLLVVWISLSVSLSSLDNTYFCIRFSLSLCFGLFLYTSLPPSSLFLVLEYIYIYFSLCFVHPPPSLSLSLSLTKGGQKAVE